MNREMLIGAGFDVNATLERFMGNESFYIRMLKKFLEDQNYEGLEKSISEKDYEEAFKYAHTLKGLCGNLGIQRLFDVNNIVVEKLRSRNTEGLEADMEKVGAAYQEAIQAIQKL